MTSQRTDLGSAPKDAVVVCPTEYGGQLEHAADLALALAAHPGTGRVWLVSRPGAREYLGWKTDHPVEIVETVPARRPASSSTVGRTLRPVLQVLDLVREHFAVRAVTAGAGPRAVIALDSTKYPVPRVLCAHRSQAVAVFVHNAQPHFDLSDPSTRERFLLWLEQSCARHAGRVITHGADQARIVRGYTSRPVVAVDLPVSTRLELTGTSTAATIPATPYALCIGELRANKGVELGIEAAARAEVPLLVRGAAESPELSYALARRASASRCVDFADGFLSREDFNEYIVRAAAIVLPYTHFDAHSGVLAKAMAAGVPVVASNLPSLCAQAGDYPHFTAVDVHDTPAFGAALRTAVDSAVRTRETRTTAATGSSENSAAFVDWDPSAAAVLGTGKP